jgi:hypothetical protein
LGSGNLDLPYGTGMISLRFGKNAQDFRYSRLKLYQAMIQSYDQYPADFRKNLHHYNFLNITKRYLTTPKDTTLAIKQKNRTLGKKLLDAWDNALEDTLDQSMLKLHQDYIKVKHYPPKWIKERAELEQKLASQINMILWSQTPAWKKVERLFNEIRDQFYAEISTLSTLSAEEKRRLIDQIQKTKLVIPGTQESDSFFNNECARTEWNAKYDFFNNHLKICAGQFNTDVIERSIAHELAHAVGSARNKFIAMDSTPLAEDIIQLSKDFCVNNIKSCPKRWAAIKSDLFGKNESLQSLFQYKENFPELRSCLQNKKMNADPEELLKMIPKQAKMRAEWEASDLADQHFFLNSIKPKFINTDGTSTDSPYYLNPCGLTSWNRERFNLKQSMEVLFLSEYLCSESQNPEIRLKQSIQMAIDLKAKIYETVIPMGGVFSDHPVMISQGFSSDTDEDFADWLGSKVLTRYLKKQTQLDADSRKNFILAQIAGFCDLPSLTLQHKDEAEVEKSYSFEPHSLNSARIRKILTPPLREFLGCEASKQSRDCRY